MFLDDGNVDLVEAGIDVALRMGDLRDSSLTARRIRQGRRVVLGTPAYFDARGEPRTPADLSDHEAVIYDRRGGGTVWSFRRGASEEIVTISGRMRSNAAEAVREAVFAGMGLAVASEWMFGRELVAGRVRHVLSDWELPPVGLWVVFPSGRNASMKARAFASFIEQDLRTEFGATGIDAH
jgi:DNA-binding transcriptional LysR family regulator